MAVVVLIVFYLLFLAAFGSLIVCLMNGSWLAAYSTKDLSIIYVLMMIDFGIFIYIAFNFAFVTPI